MSYLIYGAYGYTGALIAQHAVEQGHTPVLAGRNRQKLDPLADELGCPAHAFSLTDGFRLRSVLEEVEAVVHCAGPFVQTALPMVEACLDTGTHYLDITGEIEVFEGLMARDPDARAAEVMLLPGIGFDVVPTDCLSKGLAEAVPSATDLEIAFMGRGGVSQGTLKTAIEQMGEGGLVRRGGEVVEVPPGWSTRTVDFGDHPRTVISIPWGDVATAGHSTGIPNITVYTYLPELGRRLLRLSRYVQGILGWRPLQLLLQRLVEAWVPNPSAETRRTGSTAVWASVRDADGHTTTARLRGPEAYTFTARAAVLGAERVLNGRAPSGYQTPATAFGSGFVFDVEGVERLSIGG
jgi:saccharopine dehydrogenase (NAD+, L-lysine-forming)